MVYRSQQVTSWSSATQIKAICMGTLTLKGKLQFVFRKRKKLMPWKFSQQNFRKEYISVFVITSSFTSFNGAVYSIICKVFSTFSGRSVWLSIVFTLQKSCSSAVLHPSSADCCCFAEKISCRKIWYHEFHQASISFYPAAVILSFVVNLLVVLASDALYRWCVCICQYQNGHTMGWGIYLRYFCPEQSNCKEGRSAF